MPVYNWGGIYLGINGGYGFGKSTWTDPLNPSGTTTSGSFNVNGGLVGGTLGVNFQADAFVFGVVGDVDWQSLQGKSSSPIFTAIVRVSSLLSNFAADLSSIVLLLLLF